MVVVSCGKHAQVDHWKGVDFSDMHFKEGRQYDKMHAFGQSKSANVLFAKQIAVRWAMWQVAQQCRYSAC